MENPALSNQVSHVLLDCASVFRDGPPGASNLAAARLSDIGALEVSVSQSRSSIDVQVDASNVVVGAEVVIDWLVNELSEAHGVSREEVIMSAREHVDMFRDFRTE